MSTFRTESAGTKSLEEQAREYVDGGENGTNLEAAKDLHDRRKKGTPAEPGPITTNAVFDTIRVNSEIADTVSAVSHGPKPGDTDCDEEEDAIVKNAREAMIQGKKDASKKTPPPTARKRLSGAAR